MKKACLYIFLFFFPFSMFAQTWYAAHTPGSTFKWYWDGTLNGVIIYGIDQQGQPTPLGSEEAQQVVYKAINDALQPWVNQITNYQTTDAIHVEKADEPPTGDHVTFSFNNVPGHDGNSPAYGDGISSQMWANTEYGWTVEAQLIGSGVEKYPDLVTLLVHEWGHVFGAQHTSDANGCMYGSYDPTTTRRDVGTDGPRIVDIYNPTRSVTLKNDFDGFGGGSVKEGQWINGYIQAINQHDDIDKDAGISFSDWRNFPQRVAIAVDHQSINDPNPPHTPYSRQYQLWHDVNQFNLATKPNLNAMLPSGGGTYTATFSKEFLLTFSDQTFVESGITGGSYTVGDLQGPPFYILQGDTKMLEAHPPSNWSPGFAFVRWSDNGIDNTQNPRNYSPDDNVSISAEFKAHLGASSVAATTCNNQRKVVTNASTTYAVYQSGGSVWYTSNNGSGWSQEVCLALSNSARNPSIGVTTPGGPAYVHVVWEDVDESNWRIINYKQSTDGGSTWGNTIALGYFGNGYTVYNQDATPVLTGSSYVVAVWKTSDGLAMRVNPSYNTSAYMISGTNSSSNHPSLAYGRRALDGQEACLLAFEHGPGSICFKEFIPNTSSPYNMYWESSVYTCSSSNSPANPSIVGTFNKRVLVAWDATAGSARRVYVNERDANGTWQSPIEFALSSTSNTKPSIGVDFNASKTYLLWQSDADVASSSRALTGGNWTSAADCGQGNAPTIECGSSGTTPNVVWTTGSSVPYTLSLGKVTEQTLHSYVLALQNQTLYYAGLKYNNNHTIEKDESQRLHMVFESDGEIFYRRSLDHGSSWDITRLISPLDGNNSCPSIAVANDGSLLVVWEHLNSGTDYHIRFTQSTNLGVSWSSISNVAMDVDCGITQGPQPVIAALNGSKKMVCVWASSDGMSYRSSSSLTSFSESFGFIPGADESCEHPSLATFGPSTTAATLIYDNGGSGIYSYAFDANSNSWSGPSTAGMGGYILFPSIALDSWGGIYAAYSRWNGNQMVIRCVYGDTQYYEWNNWCYDLSVPNLDSFYPCISWYSDGEFDMARMVWPAYRGSTYTIQSNFFTWETEQWEGATVLASSSSYFPNLTHEWLGGYDPKTVWTSLPSSPFQIVLSVQGQPKRSAPSSSKGTISYRAVEIYDKKNCVTLTFKLKGMNFKKYSYKEKLKLSLANVFEYLQTEDFASGVGSIVNVEASTSLLQQDTLPDGMVSKESRSKFKAVNATLQVMNGNSKLSEIPLLSSNELTSTHERHTYNIGRGSSSAIKLVPKVTVTGEFDEKDLSFALVNGIDEVDSADVNPQGITIIPMELGSSNYPNPFNPTTQISYDLPRDGHAIVKVFDFLGRNVKTLVDSYKSAGRYAVVFDATGLASGVYFYRLELDGKSTIRKMLLLK